MGRSLIVSDSRHPSTLKTLTLSVFEESGLDGAIQYTVGVPSALIQQARDMIMRVGTEQSPAGSSVERIKDFGREFCDPSVWEMAMAKPKELCPNHDCGRRHILADCQYRLLCSGCGAWGHTHDVCGIRCSWCKKRHSERRCPNQHRSVPQLLPQLKVQRGQHSR